MEEYKVFSMMADTYVYTGTKSECEDYKRTHESVDDTMYIIAVHQ